MQPLGGAAEVQLLRHGDEVPQVAQLDHARCSLRLSIRARSRDRPNSCWPRAIPFSLGRMAPIVHTYRSGETGLFVNSYLVEGADGVVAVDALLLISDGRAFRARLEALRKPLLACWSRTRIPITTTRSQSCSPARRCR